MFRDGPGRLGDLASSLLVVYLGVVREDELFVLAGYLTPPASGVGERKANYGVATGRLDPYVANVLSQETPEVQRAVIGILTMLKNIAKGLDKPEAE